MTSLKAHCGKFLATVFVVFACYAAPARAQLDSPGVFFDPQTYLGVDDNDYPVYYLDYFQYFTYYPADYHYVYKYGFGYLYYFGGSTEFDDDAYFYDFNSDDFFYTAPDLYPYIYSFNRDTFLYYFEGSSPREFYDFEIDDFLFY